MKKALMLCGLTTFISQTALAMTCGNGDICVNTTALFANPDVDTYITATFPNAGHPSEPCVYGDSHGGIVTSGIIAATSTSKNCKDKNNTPLPLKAEGSKNIVSIDIFPTDHPQHPAFYCKPTRPYSSEAPNQYIITCTGTGNDRKCTC